MSWCHAPRPTNEKHLGVLSCGVDLWKHVFYPPLYIILLLTQVLKPRAWTTEYVIYITSVGCCMWKNRFASVKATSIINWNVPDSRTGQAPKKNWWHADSTDCMLTLDKLKEWPESKQPWMSQRHSYNFSQKGTVWSQSDVLRCN